MSYSVGSICSGIEAASVAWLPLGYRFSWFSEIASFPSRVLSTHYPEVSNIGDMRSISQKISKGHIEAPDIICAGTPCQAFSFAGWQKGLKDDRGNLTLKLVDIVNANDKVRNDLKKEPCLVFWENVVGVLSDKTNAFGCFISSLSGADIPLKPSTGKWPSAGILYGPKRTVAWRVLDAKYFGLPQQRKRLYVIAGPDSANVESIIFEHTEEPHTSFMPEYRQIDTSFVFKKERHTFELFRSYTDCLYSSYATKWNGNAAAFNGSLFVAQDQRVRRLSPLECERLMGFPDNYTKIKGATKSQRYQAIGNSWAVPVIQWFGKRILSYSKQPFLKQIKKKFGCLYDLGQGSIVLDDGTYLNCSDVPECAKCGSLTDVISSKDIPDIYLSPVGSAGIIRRKQERNANMNNRLESLLSMRAATMHPDEIERRSLIQKRGRYSKVKKVKIA